MSNNKVENETAVNLSQDEVEPVQLEDNNKTYQAEFVSNQKIKADKDIKPEEIDASQKVDTTIPLVNLAKIATQVLVDNNLLKQQTESTENEVNVNIAAKDFKFNYANVTNNPIEFFYNYLWNNLNLMIDDYFKIKFDSNKTSTKQINELTKKIDIAKQDITNKQNETKYKTRKIANGFIIFACFLIIGLFFLSKYKENKRFINEYLEYEEQKLNEINQLTNQRFFLMKMAFATLSLFDIYKYVFTRIGIKVKEILPASQILRYLNNKEYIDIKTGLIGNYKNTPFIDTIVRSLVFKIVTTSQSRSFPYLATETYYDGKHMRTRTVTRYETLTAYHKENTPFINEQNILLWYTNFEPELFFNTSIISKKKLFKKKKNKDIFLENENFLKTYELNVFGDLKNDIALSQKLNQYFTIKAQEDYYNWAVNQQNQVHSFSKVNGSIIVYNEDKNYDELKRLHWTIDDLNILKNDDSIGLDVIQSHFKSYAINYFNRVTKMMMLPLLAPAINREWYDQNQKKYMIGNYFEAVFGTNIKQEIESTSFDFFYEIYRFLDSKNLWFNTDKNPTRPIWFTYLNSVKNQNNVNHTSYTMNSYWSKILYDPVVVFGIHVGAKTIFVPYERFYFFNEQKYLAHIYFNNNLPIKIYVNNAYQKMVFVQSYIDNDFGNQVYKANLYTLNPSALENYSKKNELLNIINQFNSLNTNNQLTLTIDMYGAYIISNYLNLNSNQQTDHILVSLKNLLTS